MVQDILFYSNFTRCTAPFEILKSTKNVNSLTVPSLCIFKRYNTSRKFLLLNVQLINMKIVDKNEMIDGKLL